MQETSEEVLYALGVHAATHVLLLTALTWLLASGALSPLSVLFWGFTATALLLLVEWSLGPTLISRMVRPRWVKERDDPMLWALVTGEAAKLGLRVARIGILDNGAPNAVSFSSNLGRPVVLFSRALIVGLSHSELRGVAVHMLERTRGWESVVLTTIAGYLTVFNSMSRGYIESRQGGQPAGLLGVILAGWGYPFMSVTYPSISPLAR